MNYEVLDKHIGNRIKRSIGFYTAFRNGRGDKPASQVISESLLLFRPLIYKEAGVYG